MGRQSCSPRFRFPFIPFIWLFFIFLSIRSPYPKGVCILFCPWLPSPIASQGSPGVLQDSGVLL